MTNKDNIVMLVILIAFWGSVYLAITFSAILIIMPGAYIMWIIAKNIHYKKLINRTECLNKQERLRIFRDGIKWGFSLISHWDSETNKMIIETKTEKYLAEDLKRNVDEGKYDTPKYSIN